MRQQCKWLGANAAVKGSRRASAHCARVQAQCNVWAPCLCNQRASLAVVLAQAAHGRQALAASASLAARPASLDTRAAPQADAAQPPLPQASAAAPVAPAAQPVARAAPSECAPAAEAPGVLAVQSSPVRSAFAAAAGDTGGVAAAAGVAPSRAQLTCATSLPDGVGRTSARRASSCGLSLEPRPSTGPSCSRASSGGLSGDLRGADYLDSRTIDSRNGGSLGAMSYASSLSSPGRGALRWRELRQVSIRQRFILK